MYIPAAPLHQGFMPSMGRCLSGRKSTIGNRVYVKSVPRVRIPPCPLKQAAILVDCSLFYSLHRKQSRKLRPVSLTLRSRRPTLEIKQHHQAAQQTHQPPAPEPPAPHHHHQASQPPANHKPHSSPPSSRDSAAPAPRTAHAPYSQPPAARDCFPESSRKK